MAERKMRVVTWPWWKVVQWAREGRVEVMFEGERWGQVCTRPWGREGRMFFVWKQEMEGR